jgi:hypothetical protein
MAMSVANEAIRRTVERVMGHTVEECAAVSRYVIHSLDKPQMQPVTSSEREVLT